MTAVTYGELFDLVVTRVAAGGIAIAQQPLDMPEAARRAVVAHRDLLASVAEHAAYLSGDVPAHDRPPAGYLASPRDLAVLLLRRLLEERAARATVNPRAADHPAAAAWAGAAEALRAARDLLDTHRDPGRGWRTPDAWRLDHPDLRWQALVDLAELVDVLAPGGRDLAARVLERQHLPEFAVANLRDPQRLQAGAHAIANLAGELPQGPAIAGLGLARPALQRADPLQQALQAVGRLRQWAWEHRDARNVGTSTLGHYAAIGVLVHQHAAVAVQAAHLRAAEHWPAGSSAGVRAALAEVADACRTASTAWRSVRDELAGLRTPLPLSGSVRDDYTLVRDGLAHATRVRDEWKDPQQLVPNRATALQLLNAFKAPLALMGDVAVWQEGASFRLFAAGDVFLPAVRLTGDQVADHPALVKAKLDRSVVPASATQQRALQRSYSVAADATSRAIAAYSHALPTTQSAWRPAATTTGAARRTPLGHLLSV